MPDILEVNDWCGRAWDVTSTPFYCDSFLNESAIDEGHVLIVFDIRCRLSKSTFVRSVVFTVGSEYASSQIFFKMSAVYGVKFK